LTAHFFVANDVNREELCKSDGTAGGTLMVRDILPGGRVAAGLFSDESVRAA
jgi:ELWxxDGT repeat protein